MQLSPTAPTNRFWTGASLILIVSIAVRQLRLGDASFMPDEAIHTFFSMGFGTYKYDPVFHGPLLYHLTAAMFGLFHQNDFAARMVPSLMGIGLVALILGPARLFLGNRAALAGAALVAISPSIVTYSRRLLHDSLALFLTMGAVLCFSSALQNGAATERGRNARIGLFAFMSLFLATKANCFFIAAMLAAFWIAWLLEGRLRLPKALEKWVPTLLFAALFFFAIRFPITFTNGNGTWIENENHRVFKRAFVALCTLFGLWLLTRPKAARVETEIFATDAIENSSENAAKVSAKKTGKNALQNSFASADIAETWSKNTTEIARANAVETPRENAAYDSSESADEAISDALKTRGDIATTYFLALAGALWLYVFLFGSGAQIMVQWVQTRQFPAETLQQGAAAARSAIPRMFEYWGGQQKLPRLPGRHDYYLVLALLYEVPILVAAAGGVWHASKNRAVFTDLLLWWSFASVAVYALANEKVPWLLVHIILPLALLGGVWLGQIRWKRPLPMVAALFGVAFSARGVIGTNFENAGDHAEPIFYAHTPEDFSGALESTLYQTRGDKRPVWSDGDRQWPSVWYLRAGGPDVDDSPTALAGFPTPTSYRAAITQEKDWPLFAQSGWQGSLVTFLIFPRASWTALEPTRYWRWQWTRDTISAQERLSPSTEWKTSILAGEGEWSSQSAVIGHPQ